MYFTNLDLVLKYVILFIVSQVFTLLLKVIIFNISENTLQINWDVLTYMWICFL